MSHDAPNQLERFQSLTAAQKRSVHFELCEHALEAWRLFCDRCGAIAYRETVTGTRQEVDLELPADAYSSAKAGRDLARVDERHREPIIAMQDTDLEFPREIEFAYYSLYNLFRRYALDEPIDDWLIVNQALSADTSEAQWQRRLAEALERATAESP